MGVSRHPLDNIQVANPCRESWDSMYGDDRVRFCSSCKLNVYNLSGMSRREATELIQLVEGRLCVRFYRRRDGTLLTSDCPIGMKAISALARIASFALARRSPLGRGRSSTGGHQTRSLLDPDPPAQAPRLRGDRPIRGTLVT
jgi:hypothetical protein